MNLMDANNQAAILRSDATAAKKHMRDCWRRDATGLEFEVAFLETRAAFREAYRAEMLAHEAFRAWAREYREGNAPPPS